MCGIYFTNCIKCDTLKNFDKLSKRGPDGSMILRKNNKYFYGFHRLAIINPIIGVNQPIQYKNIVVLCNGEIYNWKTLSQLFDIKVKSDCELLIYLYFEFGKNFKKVIQWLDGEFAIILHDLNIDKVYVARDFMGMRPLYYSFNNDLTISSELKGIASKTQHIIPRSIYTFDLEKNNLEVEPYWEFSKSRHPNIIPLHTIYNELYQILSDSVRARVESDKPIGCLLSGGLDSSIIVSLVAKIYRNIRCFVIGANDSPDVVAAKKVANYLSLPLEVVPFDKNIALNTIPNVIQSLETYDITTIRASTPQWHLAKWISENTDIKVIISGEGSDELFMNGYAYTKLYDNANELWEEGERLLEELYLFDCLRTDRTMATWGLEVRVPFLHKYLVDFVRKLDPELLMYSETPYQGLDRSIEKSLLRHMAYQYYLLPDEIIWRPKEAFSDAVGFSWKDTIEKHTRDYKIQERKHLTPISSEAEWYRQIFDEQFPDNEEILQHYWMPKKFQTNDPSARVLPTYHKPKLD
jgi:asparagine synthase (glutamine-hydrolysing)